jgi:3',5'-cyclic AMP phosphodiesterase CpdA
VFRIAHISDLHCGSPYFMPDLMERAIMEINELEPEIVVCSGDLTAYGFKPEYAEAKTYLDRLDCRQLVVVTEPDLDHGHIGRSRYPWIQEQFSADADFRIFVLHHHLLPVPGTGRERNIVYDAGDTLEALQRARVNLVLSGHKHVPYAWRLENIFVVNAGTVSTLRLRGNTRPCYNLIEIEGRHVDVWRKYPYHDQERIIQFSADTLEFEKYTSRIEGEVTSRK